MGHVYRARDLKLQREVALKLLPGDMAADPERRQRFEREARAVAALNHPGIITIFSVDDVDGRVFLTMGVGERPAALRADSARRAAARALARHRGADAEWITFGVTPMGRKTSGW